MALGRERPRICGWREASSGDPSLGSNLPRGGFEGSPSIIDYTEEASWKEEGVRTRKEHPGRGGGGGVDTERGGVPAQSLGVCLPYPNTPPQGKPLSSPRLTFVGGTVPTQGVRSVAADQVYVEKSPET